MKKVRIKIEIPRDSRVKYEYDKVREVIYVDRILKVLYPFNYGFIPNTLWDDGDALDAILLGTFNLHPGVEVEATPLALIRMYDNGESDWKLVATIDGEKFEDYDEAIMGFLRSYKKGVVIDGYTTDPRAIQEALDKSKLLYVDSIK